MSHSPWHRLNATLTLAVAIFAVLVACASVTDVFHACAPTSSMPFMSRSPIVRVVDYERFARVADSRSCSLLNWLQTTQRVTVSRSGRCPLGPPDSVSSSDCSSSLGSSAGFSTSTILIWT